MYMENPTLSLEELKNKSPDAPLQAASPYTQSAERALVEARKPDAQLAEFNRVAEAQEGGRLTLKQRSNRYLEEARGLIEAKGGDALDEEEVLETAMNLKAERDEDEEFAGEHWLDDSLKYRSFSPPPLQAITFVVCVCVLPIHPGVFPCSFGENLQAGVLLLISKLSTLPVLLPSSVQTC